MTLEEYIDTIIEVAEQLKKEAIDYEKMAVLYNLLDKLVKKYVEKSEHATPAELDGASWKLSTERAIIKSEKTKVILDNLYTVTINRISGNSLPVSEPVDEQLTTISGKLGMI